MLEKSEVSTLLQNFCVMTEKQFGSSVKTVRSDNGTEFMALKSYFTKNGFQLQTSCADTPQHNGRVERKHIHILNIARACLFQAQLPIDFWGESIMTAAHIINRTPSAILEGKTPYKLLHGKAPAYYLLRVFGCFCYAHRRARDNDKFGARSRKCIFVGYPSGTKGWKLYDLEHSEFFISRDVTFFEDTFPGIKDGSYVTNPVLQLNLPSDDWLKPMYVLRGCTPSTTSPMIPSESSSPSPVVDLPSTPTAENTTPVSALPSEFEYSSPTDTNSSSVPVSPPAKNTFSSSSTDTSPAATSTPGLLEVLGRGQLTKKPSILLKNFVTNTVWVGVRIPIQVWFRSIQVFGSKILALFGYF